MMKIADWGQTGSLVGIEDGGAERLDAEISQCPDCGEKVVRIMAHSEDGEVVRELRFYEEGASNDCNIKPRHRHEMRFFPYSGDVCTNSMHLRSDAREGVWQCDCGTKYCRGCFEVIAERFTHTQK